MSELNLPSPLIGIPVHNAYEGDQDRFEVPKAYCQAVENAGGVPILIPLLENEASLERFYKLIDGLLLAGGGDMAPGSYGADDSGLSSYIDPERDRVEIFLIKRALKDGMLILGICRGIQVLNVAAGGTLIQDIPSQE